MLLLDRQLTVNGEHTMPSFLHNKWVLVVLALVGGAVLERKFAVLNKVGLGAFITPSA